MSIQDSICPTIAPSDTNLSPSISKPNMSNEIGAIHIMTFILCFIALLITSKYSGMNNNPPLVSNNPKISNPNNVAKSALLFKDSSFNPFFVSINDIPKGPASIIKSKRMNGNWISPNSALP